MKNFLDDMADDDVPVMPPQLDADLHRRINEFLLVQHLVEVICLAIPFVFFHFLHALGGAICFSLSGRYPKLDAPEPGTDHASRPEPDAN